MQTMHGNSAGSDQTALQGGFGTHYENLPM